MEYRGHTEFRPSPIPRDNSLWDNGVHHETGSPKVYHQVLRKQNQQLSTKCLLCGGHNFSPVYILLSLSKLGSMKCVLLHKSHFIDEEMEG